MDKMNGDDPMMPTEQYFSDGEIGNLKGGLTKREYFASLAMQGWCANPDWAKTLVENDWDDYTNRLTSGAVEIADKLIEELNK